jgi:phosphoribosylanthranilate isomerase
VALAEDLVRIDAYAEVADQLLIDAKPPQDGVLPGGNGLAFDWRLIAGRSWTVPWMLAGGLTPATVPVALQMTAAQQLDVSTGVESATGVKDAGSMSAFLAAAHSHPSVVN